MQKTPQKLLSILLAVTFSVRVLAYETGAQLTLQGEYAGNMTQSAVDPQSDVAMTAAARVNISHSGPVLDLSGIVLARYTDYLDNTFADQWLINSDIRADWKITDSLLWRARNQTDQVNLDPLGVNTPDNVQNQNFFSTGPELLAKIGPVTRFTLGASYARNTFSETGADNERLIGYTQLRRNVRSPLALSLNFRAQQVTYLDEPGNLDFDQADAFYRFEWPRGVISLPHIAVPFRTRTSLAVDELGNLDFDRADAFFRFEWARAAFSLQGDFGATRIQFKGAAEAQDEPLTVLLARYVTANSGNITLQLRDAVGDSTTDFDDALFSPDNPSGTTDFSVGGLFLDRRAELIWIREFGRVTGTANAFYRDRDFLESDFDQIQYGAAASLDFVLNPRWTMTISGSWDHTEFETDGREDEFKRAALRFTRNIGRKFQAFAQVAYLERDSTDILYVFDDVRFAIGIQYQIGVQPKVAVRRNRQSINPVLR